MTRLIIKSFLQLNRASAQQRINFAAIIAARQAAVSMERLSYLALPQTGPSLT
jgi:hypothetical protein